VPTKVSRVPTAKPIASAEAVAALRAVHAGGSGAVAGNPDYLARAFATGTYAWLLALPRRPLLHLVERLAPGGSCFLLARTRFMDDHLEHALTQQLRQVVILGAGYDTRAHRFQRQLCDVQVFEVDLPATQGEKLRRLRRAGIELAPNVVYVQHDFAAGALLGTLEGAGFDRNLRTLFIWEGVCYYLKAPAVEETLQLVARCPKGSGIAFDYALQSFVEGDCSTYGAARVQRWLKRNAEPFHFGLEPGELGPYASALGLALQEDIGPREMSERYLVSGNGRVLGKPYGHLRLASLASLGAWS
jgi:methyltransferase (TIGR00027 family)